MLGEQVLADLREDFLDRVLRLPLSTVERAGTGDLLTRTTSDVDALSRTVRFAVPETMVAVVTTVADAGRDVPGVAVAGTRLPGRAADPARVDALVPAPGPGRLPRRARGVLGDDGRRDRDGRGRPHRRGVAARRPAGAHGRRRTWPARTARSGYTLFLRTVWFPTVEIAYVLPVVVTLLLGGCCTSAARHARPGDGGDARTCSSSSTRSTRCISWLDELQVGGTSLARLLGVAHVPSDRVATGAEPVDEHLVAHDVRYAYTEGRDVLHGVVARPAPRRAAGRRRPERGRQVDARPPARRHPRPARPAA